MIDGLGEQLYAMFSKYSLQADGALTRAEKLIPVSQSKKVP